MTSSNDTTTALENLRGDIRGSLILPGDADYDTARTPWNLAVEQRPAAIAVPADVDDVRAVIAAATAAGLGVTTQPNGHGAAGDLDGVILIRPSAFDEITIDVQARSLRVGAGVNWGRVLSQLDGTGLIALAGSNPEINAVGYSIAGGHSMFSRAFGLASRSITAVELVDGTGTVQRVTDTSDPDLIWGLRGAGGLFGAITAIEMALHPADALFGGTIMFPPTVAADVIAAAFALGDDEPALGIDTGMMRFPDAPMVPEPMRGQTVASVAIVHIGDAASAQPVVDRLRAIGPVIADTFTEFTIGSLAAVAAEPVDPMPTIDYGRAIAAVDHASAAELVDAFLAGTEHGLARMGVRVLGGRISEQLGSELSVIGATTAGGQIGAGVVAFDPALAASAPSAFAPLAAVADRHPASGMVPTFLGAGSTLADAYDAETIGRLRAIKERVDPSGIIRNNRPLG